MPKKTMFYSPIFQDKIKRKHFTLKVYWASLVAQMVKNQPAMLETWVWSLELGRSPGEGNGYPLQYSCLKNHMDRGAWWATVHGVSRVGHDLVTNPPPPPPPPPNTYGCLPSRLMHRWLFWLTAFGYYHLTSCSLWFVSCSHACHFSAGEFNHCCEIH